MRHLNSAVLQSRNSPINPAILQSCCNPALLKSCNPAILLLALTACFNVGPLDGRAADDWTRSYPLTAGGELRIANTNGRIEVEGTEGSTVEIRARRIARAATDEAARQLLPRIIIKEDVSPSHVVLETERPGLLIGAGFEVQYQVKAPKQSVVHITTTNGAVTLAGLSGAVSARSTNGGITGRALGGSTEVRTTNGSVRIDLAAVGSDGITIETTNGAIALALPSTAKADLSAGVRNGTISITGLNADLSEQSRRRLVGRLNGGGAPIDLHTTNGTIRLTAVQPP